MLALPVIRPATAEDAKAIAALIQRTLRVSNAADYSVDEIANVYAGFSAGQVRERMQRQDVFVAALEDDSIIGTVGFGGGELWALFVAPEHQRLGLGTALVAHVEAHARQRGLRQLVLAASRTGIEFYTQLGYSQAGAPHRGGWPMAKSLTG
jgi:GNAT superfamily N-acetyltransferase